MKLFGIFGALFMAAFAPAAYADLFEINFSLEYGTPVPASGVFAYDASLPLGSQFTNFLVQWHSYSFDMTAAANWPGFGGTACGSGSQNSAASFALLDGSGPCAHTGDSPDGKYWSAYTDVGGASAHFYFFGAHDQPYTTESDWIQISSSSPIEPPLPGAPFAAVGSWTLTNATVPEPSAFSLLLTTLLAVGFVGRKRRAQPPATRTTH